MPRKKKEETKEVIEKVIRDFGTGSTRINNMLQAGYKIEDIMKEYRK